MRRSLKARYFSPLLAAVAFLSTPAVIGSESGIDTMIEDIVSMTSRTASFTGVEAIDHDVLEIMRSVDRKLFVPTEVAAYAYINQALPIRSQQTISQPYIVALMTHLLKVDEEHKVLEIGTGSGYQAAILARLVEKVFSIEIIPSLGREAEQRLLELGYENVEVKIGDGWFGWEEHAPFDRIIVTAQSPVIPEKLVSQLKVGGIMVIPIGKEDHVQTLEVVTKSSEHEIDRRKVLSVAFVPMTGEAQNVQD